MAENIKEHLQNAFEDLVADEMKKFKNKLCDRTGEPRVRRATIEKVKDAMDLTNLMWNTFTKKDAVPVTVEILKTIDCNAVAEELIEKTGQSEPKKSPPDEPKKSPSDESNKSPSDEHFIDKNWKTLIARVYNVDAILDELLQKKVITNEDYGNIRAKETPQKKMRELLIGPITSAGKEGKDVLYVALKETERYLMKELENAH